MKKLILTLFVVGAALAMSFTEKPEVEKDAAQFNSQTEVYADQSALVAPNIASVFTIVDYEVRNEIAINSTLYQSLCFECTPSIFGGCSRLCIDAYGHSWMESCGCPKKPQT